MNTSKCCSEKERNFSGKTSHESRAAGKAGQPSFPVKQSSWELCRPGLHEVGGGYAGCLKGLGEVLHHDVSSQIVGSCGGMAPAEELA